jgi:Arc/MetJ-type ribon-helix-helix transcriptional regulator
MAKEITIKLNQQQLELIDRLVAEGAGSDRAALIRRALRELAKNETEQRK